MMKYFVVLLLMGWLCSSRAQPNSDWRNIENAVGVIPDEHYSDQPYVVIAKNGDWVCVLTTGPGTESQKGQHIVATISSDKGKSWSELISIEESRDRPSSWGIPYVTPYGRIYVFYTFNGDNITSFADGSPLNQHGHNTELGWYCLKYSDDHGRTWSDRHRIPMRKTTIDYINPWNGDVQLFWGVSKPFSDQGSVYFSYTKMAIHPQDMGEGFLYRSDNLDTERDINKIQWELLPEGNTGISYTPMGLTQEEHIVVPMNSGSLYCVYRTSEGYVAESYSHDQGKSWSTPRYLTYTDGRVVKNPRACPRVFRCKNGNYLLWHHNNNIKGYKGHRNPVWVSGGVEVDGKINWSQPEVLLYGPEGIFGMSYPDLIEEDGNYWITETQKEIARVHRIDKQLLEDMWRQGYDRKVTQNGLIFEESNIDKGVHLSLPGLADLTEGAISIELVVDIAELNPGRIIFDNTDLDSNGIKITVTPERTLKLTVRDGENEGSLDTEPGMLEKGLNHVVFIIDGAPNLMTAVVNGKLCDGGRYRLQGWGWFSPEIKSVDGGPARITSISGLAIRTLRVYNRYLTTSEAIANYLAERNQ